MFFLLVVYLSSCLVCCDLDTPAVVIKLIRATHVSLLQFCEQCRQISDV